MVTNALFSPVMHGNTYSPSHAYSRLCAKTWTICTTFTSGLGADGWPRSTGRLAKQGPNTAVGPCRKAVRSKVCSKRKQLVNRENFYDE